MQAGGIPDDGCRGGLVVGRPVRHGGWGRRFYRGVRGRFLFGPMVGVNWGGLGFRIRSLAGMRGGCKERHGDEEPGGEHHTLRGGMTEESRWQRDDGWHGIGSPERVV